MTETILGSVEEAAKLFEHVPPRPARKIATGPYAATFRTAFGTVSDAQAVLRGFGAAPSGLLRSPVDVKLVAVDELAFSQLAEGIEYPTCLNVLRAEPLPGQLLLELKLDILFPIIDRLLGGGREPSPILRRPLTEIELRLATRVTSLFLEELRRAWSDVVPLRLSVERVESDPHSVGWVKSAQTHRPPFIAEGKPARSNFCLLHFAFHGTFSALSRRLPPEARPASFRGRADYRRRIGRAAGRQRH
jgi:hypothetical protein